MIEIKIGVSFEYKPLAEHFPSAQQWFISEDQCTVVLVINGSECVYWMRGTGAVRKVPLSAMGLLYRKATDVKMVVS